MAEMAVHGWKLMEMDGNRWKWMEWLDMTVNLCKSWKQLELLAMTENRWK